MYRLFSLLLIISISVLFGTVFALGATEEKPNIIIILSDDLGWADIGWHGKEIKTPALDKLAEQGVRLENFYVMPVCTPTRAALMTGRYPIRYGLQTAPLKFWSDHGLSKNERTLPEALKEAGYFTAICGKWHLGHGKAEYLPQNRGFDHQYGLYLGMTDYYTRQREGVLDWHRNGKLLKEEGYATNLIADEAIRVIESHENSKPFFLYVAFNAVHGPYQAPPEEKFQTQYPDLKGTRKTYAQMVASMDAQIARIMEAVDEKKIKDNTIIIFFNDNGGPQPGVVTSNGHLRAGKGSLYEGGVRVPACVLWPGKLKPGTINKEIFHIVDLYPTLLNIAGVSTEQKNPIDGIDRKKALLEGEKTENREILINVAPANGAIRIGDWKLVLKGQITESTPFPREAKQKPELELFNLKLDPSEKNNLVLSEPEKSKELFERYKTYLDKVVPPLFSPKPRGFKVPEHWGEFD